MPRPSKFIPPLFSKTLSCLVLLLTASLNSELATEALGEPKTEPLQTTAASESFREAILGHGISAEAALTLDYFANVSGGLSRDRAALGNLDLTTTLDTEKANLWRGGTLFGFVLANFGEAPSEFIGDSQVTSNIEAPESIKLFEAWINQTFFDDHVSVLIGLHDYNTEFATLEFASCLLNSSFGISPDIAQVSPSIFPTTAPALRLKLQPTSNSYLLLGVYDGIPGNPSNSRGTHIHFGDDDGAFSAFELGLVEEQAHYKKLGLGFWHHSKEYEDFSGTEQNSNSGAYVIGEQNLFVPGLGAFVQLGVARQARNQISEYLGLGLSFLGLFTSRQLDQLSIGIAHARNGSRYIQSQDAKSAESAIELNYRMVLGESLAITPDFQWIINPGTEKGTEDAVVFALRLEASI